MEALTKKQKLTRYLKSLKYSLYCMSHPLDGFWDLTHEKRGTVGAATTILFVSILVRILKLKYTSFVMLRVNWEEINIFLYIASILFPLGLWVIGNWGSTTLFDGKGRLKDIYMATCYGMAPYPLIQIPLMAFSNVVTIDEAEFHSVISAISLVYCAILIISGMSQIHDYSMGKNLLFTLITLFAMLVIIFILMLFFSMITQGVAYFISLGKEMLFRL